MGNTCFTRSTYDEEQETRLTEGRSSYAVINLFDLLDEDQCVLYRRGGVRFKTLKSG